MKSTVTLMDGMHFKGELQGFEIPLDADAQFGGAGKGMKPKDLVLTSLAGCTAMDVVAILRKMRLEPESFSVEAIGELTDDHPKIYKHIQLIFRIAGSGITEEKVRKAAELSQTKYCGVTAMLKPLVPISYEIEIL